MRGHRVILTVNMNQKPRPPSMEITRIPATCRLPYKFRSRSRRRPYGSFARAERPRRLRSLPLETGREPPIAAGNRGGLGTLVSIATDGCTSCMADGSPEGEDGATGESGCRSEGSASVVAVESTSLDPLSRADGVASTIFAWQSRCDASISLPVLALPKLEIIPRIYWDAGPCQALVLTYPKTNDWTRGHCSSILVGFSTAD